MRPLSLVSMSRNSAETCRPAGPGIGSGTARHGLSSPPSSLRWMIPRGHHRKARLGRPPQRRRPPRCVPPPPQARCRRAAPRRGALTAAGLQAGIPPPALQTPAWPAEPLAGQPGCRAGPAARRQEAAAAAPRKLGGIPAAGGR